MKSLDQNNPILYFPASNMEEQEFKLQGRMNVLAKINLGKIAREMDAKKGIVITSSYDLRIFLS